MRVGGRTQRQKRRRVLQVGGLGLVTMLAVLSLSLGNSSVLDRLSALVFDVYQQIKPRQEAGAPIVIVDVDEASLAEAGQWPWPRSQLALIVDRLGELGAATVAFDLVFAEPDRTSLAAAVSALRQAGAEVVVPTELPDNDQLLSQAFARNRVTAGFVLTNELNGGVPEPKGGFAYAGENPDAYLISFEGGVSNLPGLTQSAAGMGFFSFPPSPDGVVRVLPLVAKGGGQLYPALSVEALRVAQSAGSIVIRATGASGEADTGRAAMTALKVGALEVPTGPAGEFRVYYSGLPSVPRISATQLLDPAKAAELTELIAGRIVLFGSSSVGLRDIVTTPLDSAIPGVYVHAEIIDQILGGTFLTRPDWAPGAELAAAVLCTFFLLGAVLSFGPLLGALAAITISTAALAGSWFTFAVLGIVLDPLLPSVSVLAVYMVVTAFILLLTDRERQFVRRAFSQYLSPSLVEQLADDPAALSLGGETRELTILFSDIRGFTGMSEKLDPQEVTRVLNQYLTPMTDVLLQAGATIDKYIGDAIMAFWNAPLATADHPRRACMAVLAMMNALEELNRREGLSLKIGVGLNTGPCCVGNLGSEQRFSYSAIGDAVNVTARVEGLTKQYGLPVLITEGTAARAGGLAFLEIDLVQVVGRDAPLAVFTLLGDETFAGSAEFRTLSAAHSQMIANYRKGDFLAAAAALDEARGLAPEPILCLYELYAERLSRLMEEPRDQGWIPIAAASRK